MAAKAAPPLSIFLYMSGTPAMMVTPRFFTSESTSLVEYLGTMTLSIPRESMECMQTPSPNPWKMGSTISETSLLPS